jgi:hypothetical protein
MAAIKIGISRQVLPYYSLREHGPRQRTNVHYGAVGTFASNDRDEPSHPRRLLNAFYAT